MPLLRRAPSCGGLAGQDDPGQSSGASSILQRLLPGGAVQVAADGSALYTVHSNTSEALSDIQEDLPLSMEVRPLLSGADDGSMLPASSVQSDKVQSKESKEALSGGKDSTRSRSCIRWLAVAAVVLWNCASTIGIVVVNKLVYVTHGFTFPVALSWLHVCFTAAGMAVVAACGGMAARKIPWVDRMQVAVALAAYVVLGNLSLQLNTVGFYQLMKIGIAPAIVLLQWVGWRQKPTPKTCAAVAVLLTGIVMATVTDKEVSTHLLGAGVGVLSTLRAALYQVWTGRKQQDLSINGNQLLQQVAPAGALLLTLLVPLMEPVGLWGCTCSQSNSSISLSSNTSSAPAAQDIPPAAARALLHLAQQPTLMNYSYTPAAVGTILLSCMMGLSVTLSSYWAIGMTSPLTFNVLGHLKTAMVLAAGILVFGDTMTWMKGGGLLLSMCGVVWYSMK